jgi:hypothetical protein
MRRVEWLPRPALDHSGIAVPAARELPANSSAQIIVAGSIRTAVRRGSDLPVGTNANLRF